MFQRENTHVRDKLRQRARDELGIPSVLLQLRFDAGWPDVLFLVPGGRPTFMEIKLPGEPLEPLQVYRIELLQKLDYDALGPISDVDDGIELLKDRLKRAKDPTSRRG